MKGNVLIIIKYSHRQQQLQSTIFNFSNYSNSCILPKLTEWVKCSHIHVEGSMESTAENSMNICEYSQGNEVTNLDQVDHRPEYKTQVSPSILTC